MLGTATLALFCAALHPGASPVQSHTRAASAIASSRQHAIVMREMDKRGTEPKIDNALVRSLRWSLSLLKRDKKPSLACGATKYGCDPRVDDDLADDVETPVVDGTPFSLAEPGVVGELNGGVAHLAAALAYAGEERAVVLKFKRVGCLACNATVAPLASAALAYAGRADFYEVDYTQSRAFCRQCALRVVPCAHVYMDGKLVDASPLGPRAFAAFAERLETLVGAPSSEVLEAEIPADKRTPDARHVAGLDLYL